MIIGWLGTPTTTCSLTQVTDRHALVTFRLYILFCFLGIFFIPVSANRDELLRCDPMESKTSTHRQQLNGDYT